MEQILFIIGNDKVMLMFKAPCKILFYDDKTSKCKQTESSISNLVQLKPVLNVSFC